MLPATSHAHYGDLWFQTAADTGRNIVSKYPKIADARCFPKTWTRGALNAHSLLTNETRRWDHFACLVQPKNTTTLCMVVAHISGGRWSDFYLTSWAYNGCRPYDIR